MKPVILTAVAVASLLALTGCGLLPSAPPSASPSASSPAPEPSASPSEEPAEPAERTASTPFDEWDAYLACRQLTPPYFYSESGGDFYEVEYESFDDSFIHLRDDDLFFVYSEVENGNVDPSLASAAAANCVVGGTLGTPLYAQFGATVRLTDAEIDAAKDAPLDAP
jgi:hypothetical protein